MSHKVRSTLRRDKTPLTKGPPGPVQGTTLLEQRLQSQWLWEVTGDQIRGVTKSVGDDSDWYRE